MDDDKDNQSIKTENDELSYVVELDEPENEVDEQISGNKLDELEAESNEESPENDSQKGIGKKLKGKKWLWLLILTGLLLLSAAGGYFLVKRKIFFFSSNENVKQNLNTANDLQQRRPAQVVIKKEETLEFKSFVIPFKPSGKFTYISLSITCKLPDKEAKRKMILEKKRIRAMIYNTIKEKINIYIETSSLQVLKTIIIRAVHDTLATDRINYIEIKDFQAV